MHRSVISVVIPAYNEEKTLGNVIEETISVMDSMQTPYELIIVDDGSTDNTRKIAANYKAIVLSNGKNQGKGHALRKGFQHASGDIIVTIDADGSHKPKEIPELIQPLFNGTDVVAGSRFLGYSKDFTPRINQVGNFLLNATITVFTGKQLTDSQTGFRAFKRRFLEEIGLRSIGYEIETEITVKSLKNGFKVQERPITCERRKSDASKLRIIPDGARIFTTILKARFM